MTLYSFKASKNTRRFRKNQRVWVRAGFANHSCIRFKYRGSGRYVNGVIDNYSKVITAFEKFEVDEEFYNRVKGNDKDITDKNLDRFIKHT